MLNTILSWIVRSFTFGAVIMYGAMGETLTQKSGNMNLGTPGIMCIGGAFGFAGGFLYEHYSGTPNPVLAILITLVCGFIFASLAGLLFVFLTTTLRANQNVAGLALTIFGTGLAKFTGSFIIPTGVTTAKANQLTVIFSKKIPLFTGTDAFSKIVNSLFFQYGFMFYLAIILAILMQHFLYKTRTGLNLRSVGESPATADAAGIPVEKNKYLATIIGAGIAGLGGVYYVMDYNMGQWSTAACGAIEALGWLSVALVIFAVWRPVNLLWGSILFGLAFWFYNYVSAFGWILSTAQSSLLESVPYLITILVLVISSIRKKRESQPPQSLGLAYFREER